MITLDEIKDQLNLEQGDTLEDALLTRLSSVAVEQVKLHLNAPMPDPVPESLKQAALLLVGHMYENREATNDRTIKHVPMTFDWLVSMYRNEVVR